MLDGFGRRSAEKFFEQICPAGDAEFFGEDAQRVFRRDKVNAGNALVSFKGTQRLASENRAGCARDGEGEIQLLAPSF